MTAMSVVTKKEFYTKNFFSLLTNNLLIFWDIILMFVCCVPVYAQRNIINTPLFDSIDGMTSISGIRGEIFQVFPSQRLKSSKNWSKGFYVITQALGITGDKLAFDVADSKERASERKEKNKITDELSDQTISISALGALAYLFSEDSWVGNKGFTTIVKTLIILSIFSVAPALLLMTTSYIRISVVLTLLRQALGINQVPSNQVLVTLAVFITILIMTPVWTQIYDNALVPYSEGDISKSDAFERGQVPIRTFLWKQIKKSGNIETINVFYRYMPNEKQPKFYEDIPWQVLAPAFVLSELKVAFLVGFQILLPFLIIDVVVSCVLTSTGMMMLPPTIISLPFKLALFVLVDGWSLIVKSLLASFAW